MEDTGSNIFPVTTDMQNNMNSSLCRLKAGRFWKKALQLRSNLSAIVDSDAPKSAVAADNIRLNRVCAAYMRILPY